MVISKHGPMIASVGAVAAIFLVWGAETASPQQGRGYLHKFRDITVRYA